MVEKRSRQKKSKFYFKIPKNKAEKSIAPVWKRFVAFVIDMIIFSVFINEPFFSLYLSRSGIMSSEITLSYVMLNPQMDGILTTASVISSLLLLVYFSVLEIMFSATVGKYLLRISVEDGKGKSPSILQALLRNLPKVLIPVLVIDCLGMFSATRQRIADMIAGTYVVHTPKNFMEGLI
ncbi:MAG: RDD family protein [Candidatus Omnitrophica bacterium]|nr:RDD family protein [Candidatus Omnitrophota bacterium]